MAEKGQRASRRQIGFASPSLDTEVQYVVALIRTALWPSSVDSYVFVAVKMDMSPIPGPCMPLVKHFTPVNEDRGMLPCKPDYDAGPATRHLLS